MSAAPDVQAEVPARADTPAAGAKKVRPDQTVNETPAEYWARKTAYATQFIAWIVGLAAVASVILGIIVAVQVSHLNSSVNGGGSSNCMSLGGTNPNC